MRSSDVGGDERKKVTGGESQVGRVFCLYLPVLHRGAWELFDKYPDVDRILLLDREEVGEYYPAKKDLHALGMVQMQTVLAGLQRFVDIEKLTSDNIDSWRQCQFIVAEEEVERVLGDWAIEPKQIIRENIWLHWTRAAALAEQEVRPDREMTSEDIQVKELINQAKRVGEGSSDWWRQVGAILRLASGEILVAHNQHLPESQTPYIVGDIRGQFHRGEHWELGSAIHAEAGVIAQAAKLGKLTAGGEIWVTDFPCPNCAKLIGMAGIKRVYYQKGYAVADGREILERCGVEVVRVAEELSDKSS